MKQKLAVCPKSNLLFFYIPCRSTGTVSSLALRTSGLSTLRQQHNSLVSLLLKQTFLLGIKGKEGKKNAAPPALSLQPPHAGRQAALLDFDCSRFAVCFHNCSVLLCNFQPPAGCSALLQFEMAVATGFRTNSS